MVLAKPGSITPHTKFKGEVYVLTKEEGGRHTPFFTGYRPQFYFRTTDVTGVATLPEGVEMVMPGDNTQMDGGADHADRDGEGAALRHPRGRPHRRRRHRHRDHRVGAKTMRDNITLQCPDCKRRNYATTKNKKKTTERLELQQVLPVLPQAHGAQGDEGRRYTIGQ